jgi:hypothetical protein
MVKKGAGNIKLPLLGLNKNLYVEGLSAFQ